jgi:hypothetical protein
MPERIDVTPLREPDPSWRYKDKSGHVHRWVNGELPTLRQQDVEPAVRVEEDDTDDAYHDAYAYDGYVPSLWYWACRECGQRVNPRYRTPMFRQYRVVMTEEDEERRQRWLESLDEDERRKHEPAAV